MHDHDRPPTCVSRVPIFADLPPDEQALVAELTHPVQLGAGEKVHAPTDSDTRLSIVHSGRVKVFRYKSDGTEQILRVLRPGDFVGESSVITGRPPSNWASALDNGTRLCTFLGSDLRRLIRQRPQIGIRMMAALAGRLEDAERRLIALGSEGVGVRLADYLLGLPISIVDGGPTVLLPLAKKDIASLLDTTPESISRALRSLAAQGVISVEGATVTILDAETLQSMVQ